MYPEIIPWVYYKVMHNTNVHSPGNAKSCKVLQVWLGKCQLLKTNKHSMLSLRTISLTWRTRMSEFSFDSNRKLSF